MSIESNINSFIDAFEQATSGMFEISGRYSNAFEQGIYGCAIAKPSKRMRSTLGVDREVLVVFSTFAEQQQRIVRFIRKEIDRSYGRYEPTLAVVVHQDAEGNSKLKNWGRDQGLVLLPIQRDALRGSKAEIERALCVELYSHDPFDVTGPVSDDSNFYGRRDEAIDLARKLQRGQIRSCLGIRKVGKTSIINRVLREIKHNYTAVCVMIDCSRDDVWRLTAAQLLNSINYSVQKGIETSSKYESLVVLHDEVDISVARIQLQEVVRQSTEPVIIIFDEIDYITPGSPTNARWKADFNLFWRNLRSVYQENSRHSSTLSILVGGVSTYWFTVESIDGVENASLAFVPEEYLTPMPLGATVAMLKRLARIAGLQLDDSAAELIGRATGNMPYWARKCCSYIHRQVPINARPCAISVERISPLIQKFVREEGAAIAEVALRHLFRVHPDLEKAVEKCHKGEPEKVPESSRRSLRKYGVLAEPLDELSGEMIKAAYESLAAAMQAGQTIVAASPEGGLLLSEWAEELATISKRRNVLERKLRDLVLNFIRFDALVNGQAAMIRDRVGSVLQESQRVSMKHLSVDELISKFTWLELTKLIAKEWKLFERVFGDKQAFLQHADIVNDRFDAHAKAADAADLALYRRSLTFLEEKVARL